MADCFAGCPIFDQTGTRRDLAWLRSRYGQSPQFVGNGWSVERVWEQSQAMSCGVSVRDPAGSGIVGVPCVIGWGDTRIEAETRDRGWIDVPIKGGEYNAGAGAKGPMFITAKDGSWSYTGIGWPYETNHDHLNLDIRRTPGGGALPPEVTPVPPDATTDVAAIRADLVMARTLIDRALGRLP